MKKWRLILPSLTIAAATPLVSLVGCGFFIPSVKEPEFSQLGKGEMSDAKTAEISINWKPTSDSITLSDFAFTCKAGAINGNVTPISEPGDRPYELQITFANDIEDNITDGVLSFHYDDKTAKVSKDGSVTNIKISKYNPPQPTYDISITDQDKNGYITTSIVEKAYFEYDLSFVGLVEGDTIVSKITASTKNKTKIAEGYAEHVVTGSDIKDKGFKLRVVPASLDPDQPVFSDEMSIQFEFKHSGDKCFEKTIDGFILDAALPTKPEYFTYDENDSTILTGFDLTNHKADLLYCGVLVVPETVTSIADKAFSVSEHKEYAEIYQNIKWLVLDKSFKGECALKTIGASAFKDCNFYETLYIPSTIERINSDAFSSCAFSNFVYLGNTESTLNFVDSRAFAGCRFGQTLSIPNAHSFTTLKDNVFGLALQTQPGKIAKKLIIPKNIQTFEKGCLSRFTDLEVLDLSDYDTVPAAEGFAQYSFMDFPKGGTIYISDSSLEEEWKNVFSLPHVFEDFSSDKWTFEVKDTNN
ncbi:MAG: leucine-rich repeat protein [Mycoplasmoidaceae bacterium]